SQLLVLDVCLLDAFA
ncbi:DUF645 family protein, partial [Vibrio cholerae]|nr:DUF645 family protein [Vibrio cholerae]ELK1818484.1 DUF645 family protein [Vibrio cholerae]